MFVCSLYFLWEVNRDHFDTLEKRIIDLNPEIADIDTREAIATVDEEFLSVGMGWKTIFDWNYNATTEQRIIALTKALSPAYVRFGGVHSNFVEFHFSEERKKSPFGKLRVHHCTGKDLDRINQIAKNAGWQVLFALSAYKRSIDGLWDASNSFKIIKYAADKGYKFKWELGNGKENYITTAKSHTVCQ